MGLTLRQLAVFRCLAAHGNTRSAAAEIGLTPSAVNRILCQMEDELGTQLFNRTRGQLTATAEGLALANVVVDILQSYDQIESITKDQSNSQYRTLRIGSITTLSPVLLPRVVSILSKRYGNIRFSIKSAKQNFLETSIENGDLDLAVVVLPAEHGSANIQTVGTLSRVCILPLGHRLASRDIIQPSDLIDEEFISHTESSKIRRITDEFFVRNQVQRTMAFEGRSTEIRCAMVAQGLGVSLALRPYAEMWSKRLVIRPFLHDYPFQVGVVSSAKTPLSQVGKDFISELKTVVASLGRDRPKQDRDSQLDRSAVSKEQHPRKNRA